jgi:thiamine biosynthesis protein ThiS
MRVIINGEPRDIPDGMFVTGMLAHLGLDANRVAIERNRDILPRTRWNETPVQANDSYEIVQLVGGG